MASFQEILLILHIGAGLQRTHRSCREIHSWTVIKNRCLFFFLSFGSTVLGCFFFLIPKPRTGDCRSPPAVEPLEEVAQAAVEHRSFPVSVGGLTPTADSRVKSWLFENLTPRRPAKMPRRPVRAQ